MDKTLRKKLEEASKINNENLLEKLSDLFGYKFDPEKINVFYGGAQLHFSFSSTKNGTCNYMGRQP